MSDEEIGISEDTMGKMIANQVGQPEKEGGTSADSDLTPRDDPPPSSEIVVHQYGIELKFYPVTCPHCGKSHSSTGKIYPKLFAKGSTRKKFAAKKIHHKGKKKIKLIKPEEVKQRSLL